MIKATLKFPNLSAAKKFSSFWAARTLCGNDQSAVDSDGSVSVTVYDICDEKKKSIEGNIAKV